MTLRTIALKNLTRRKGKMALIVFGLALAVATLISVTSIIGAFQGAVDEQLNEYGFNIVIFAKAKEVLIQYGDMTIGTVGSYKAPVLGEDAVARVAAEAGAGGRIRGYSAKLLDVAEVKGKRVLMAGVDFAAERRIKKWWMLENGAYPRADNEVFVGQGAAEKLKLAPGDDIALKGGVLRVAGILMETGSQDDELIFGNLEHLRKVADKPGQITLIEVAAKRTEDADGLVKSLGRALPGATVQSVKEAVDFKANTLGHLIKFGFGVTAIVTLISAVIVFTMMASAVNERRAEIGIFRAIGYRRRKIASIILTEAFILGVIGGLVGYLFGFGLAQLLPVVSRGAVAVITPNPLLIIVAMALASGIGIAGSLVPAWRAANLDPVEALKSL